MEIHPSNPSTWEVETGWLGIQSYLQLQNKLKTSMNNMRPYFKKGKKKSKSPASPFKRLLAFVSTFKDVSRNNELSKQVEYNLSWTLSA